MTDKEKIKQEIERRINDLKGYVLKKGSDQRWVTAIDQLTWIKAFIDSLPEEYNEDLEEEINHISKNEYFDFSDWKSIAYHFAEWQKNQMKETLQTEYEKGRFDMREEMMKDAVNGTVKYEIGSAEIPQFDRRYQVLSDPTPITNAKLGDKVKIIILKED